MAERQSKKGDKGSTTMDKAHAYYPAAAHEVIVTEIIPALRKRGEVRTIQDIVSEGVQMAIEKYVRQLKLKG